MKFNIKFQTKFLFWQRSYHFSKLHPLIFTESVPQLLQFNVTQFLKAPLEDIQMLAKKETSHTYISLRHKFCTQQFRSKFLTKFIAE